MPLYPPSGRVGVSKQDGVRNQKQGVLLLKTKTSLPVATLGIVSHNNRIDNDVFLITSQEFGMTQDYESNVYAAC